MDHYNCNSRNNSNEIGSSAFCEISFSYPPRLFASQASSTPISRQSAINPNTSAKVLFPFPLGPITASKCRVKRRPSSGNCYAGCYETIWTSRKIFNLFKKLVSVLFLSRFSETASVSSTSSISEQDRKQHQ